MEAKLYNKDGKSASKKVKLADAIFGIEPNEHAVYLDVKAFLAAKRQGTHKSKERSEVVGSTRKIKKQKGTGTARAGDIKNPLFVGGGRVFGPEPRDYAIKLNKKMKRLARRSALSLKAKSDRIAVIEEMSMSAPKTKDFMSVLSNMSLEGKKTTIVLDSNDQNVILSVRNVPNSKTISADELNTYEIMNADNLVLTQKSLDRIKEILS